jgi:prepilin-type N-terminal cleavage/methylation domain-containing protein
MQLRILSRYKTPSRHRGFSLIELLAVLVIASLILAALAGVVSQSLETERVVRSHNELQQQMRFAMKTITKAVQSSTTLLVPLAENPSTLYSESIRDVLAITLDPNLDRDKDGFADADNDQDGSVDEDLGNDTTNDSEPGIINIDDNGDGTVDNGASFQDDDEDGFVNDDMFNGIDDDNDGAIDEDSNDDMNEDNKAGIEDVDDDNDGNVDEGNKKDDDEDGQTDEDWLDVVAFYLSGTTLIQRIPNIDPSDGTDYTEYTLAENVSQLRIERIQEYIGQTELLDITISLTNADGETAQLNTRVRLGADL